MLPHAGCTSECSLWSPGTHGIASSGKDALSSLTNKKCMLLLANFSATACQFLAYVPLMKVLPPPGG